VATIVDAFALQNAGNSVACCSKIVSPVFQLVWTMSRLSHVTSAYGCTPGVVNTRSIRSPFGAGPAPLGIDCVRSVIRLRSFRLMLDSDPAPRV
jgi:hypothetical protein